MQNYTQDEYEYLEELSVKEGCITMPSPNKRVTMPSPYKPIPRNDNNRYNTYIKNVVVAASPSKNVRTVNNPAKPADYSVPAYNPGAKESTYVHPIQKGMVCIYGFDPGPGRILGKPINPTETKDSSLAAVQQQPTQSQQGFSQNDKPFPLTQFTNNSQQYTTTNSSQEFISEPSKSESISEPRSMANAKIPPHSYPHYIVDAFNDAVFAAATEPSVLQKLTEFIEYEQGRKTVTTTFLFHPFNKGEVEERLCINVAEKSASKKRLLSNDEYPGPTPKRACTVTTTWMDNSRITKQFH
jgi:hypothetical protein